jgi:hypothetical protein
MIYLLIYALLIFLCITARRSAERRAAAKVAWVGLFLFSAFRWEVGCDWFSYQSLFDRTADGLIPPAFWGFEQSWHWSNVLIAQMGLNFAWVNVVTSAIFFIGAYALARRSGDPLLFLTVLFPFLILGMAMSGIRQGAAIGFLCLAFVAFLDRRPLRFGIMIVLGTTFHSSAMVFALLLPLCIGRYTKKRIVLAGLLALPGAFLLSRSDAADTALLRYVNTGLEAAGAWFRTGLLAMLGLYFLFSLRLRWKRISPVDYPLVSLGAMMMVATAPLVTFSSVIADRIGYSLIPIAALIVARISYVAPPRNLLLHVGIPMLVLSTAFTVWSAFSGQFQGCYLPYSSWILGLPNYW